MSVTWRELFLPPPPPPPRLAPLGLVILRGASARPTRTPAVSRSRLSTRPLVRQEFGVTSSSSSSSSTRPVFLFVFLFFSVTSEERGADQLVSFVSLSLRQFPCVK